MVQLSPILGLPVGMDAAATITATASFTGLATRIYKERVYPTTATSFLRLAHSSIGMLRIGQTAMPVDSHTNEEAHAGYYQVYLEDQHIDVELTTTKRVGIHRYRLDESDTLSLIIDMQHRDALIHYSIYPVGDSMLVGHRVSDNWAREQHVYFAARFDQPFEWRDQLTEVRNVGIGAAGELLQEVEYVPVFAADFGVVSELNAEVALSFVSIEGAMANLEAEATLDSFDAYRNAAEHAWDEQLSCIAVEGGSEDETETFYSALYHCFTAPNIANDVNGQYRGTDLKVHQLGEDEGDHYTVFSFGTLSALCIPYSIGLSQIVHGILSGPCYACTTKAANCLFGSSREITPDA